MSWPWSRSDCDGITAWFPDLNFELHSYLLDNCIVVNNAPSVKPFKHVSLVGVRIKDSYDVQELYMTLKLYLDELKVNHGMILTWAGVLIFTEEKLEINTLMFKLSTGSNIVASQEYNISEWIKTNPVLLKWFAGLVRE